MKQYILIGMLKTVLLKRNNNNKIENIEMGTAASFGSDFIWNKLKFSSCKIWNTI